MKGIKHEMKTRYIVGFNDGGPYLIETSLLISMDWFLYDRDLRHERVKSLTESAK